jgi:hypothetical protein
MTVPESPFGLESGRSGPTASIRPAPKAQQPHCAAALRTAPKQTTKFKLGLNTKRVVRVAAGDE